MTCHDTTRLICDYLEGRLSPAVEDQITEHLCECQDCYRVFEAAEGTLETYFGAQHRVLPHPHAV